MKILGWFPHDRRSGFASLRMIFTEKLKNETDLYAEWQRLIENLESERELARENMEYLGTLYDYFVVSIM